MPNSEKFINLDLKKNLKKSISKTLYKLNLTANEAEKYR